VATDGHRLALVTRGLENVGEIGLEAGSIVPRKGIREILRLIDEEEKIKLGFVDKGLIARARDEILFIRLVEGDFPNYRAVIPEAAEQSVKVDRLRLMEVVERVKPITTERYRAMGIAMSADKLTVEASNPERGEAKEIIEIEYAGPDVRMGFNPDYIIDNLAAVASENVVLEFTDSESPCAIKDEEDDNFLGVIMPMRL
jgi:DNA polymerase-3 subunit beta